MKITINKVLSWGPCKEYNTKEKLLKITKGKTSLTLKEVSQLKIPAKDRIWILLRPEILGKRNCKEIGNKIADRAIRKHCLKCGIKEVESWAQDWLSGKDRSYANAANAANAARASAVYSADAATGANAADVAVDAIVATYAAIGADAAYVADVAVAARAARAATDVVNAVSDAERKWQLNIIKKYLDELKESN